MPLFACQGLQYLHTRNLSARQKFVSPFSHRLRGFKYATKAVSRVPTHAANQTPLEVEVLPGPASGTYRFRRTMSQQQHVCSTSPFIIGVAGGTASGKTSVCESFPYLVQRVHLHTEGSLANVVVLYQ